MVLSKGSKQDVKEKQMNKSQLKKIKKARDKIDDAILGYCDGNVAQELDEAFSI